jgi:uncharacterized OB-fold protein
MSDRVDDPLLHRPVPVGDPLCDFFWASGADGNLRILRCAACGCFVHPPSVPCPRCLSVDLAPAPVSGLGEVSACTVNVHQWTPDQAPYAIAVIELAEQPGLRLTSNVVGCPPHDVHIGQPVRVCFVHRHGLYYPVFVPCDVATQ